MNVKLVIGSMFNNPIFKTLTRKYILFNLNKLYFGKRTWF